MNIEDLISSYLDGELSAEAEAEMHYHLSLSPEGRKLFREHTSLRGAAKDRELLAQPSQVMRAALFSRLAQEGMDRSTASQAGMMPDATRPVDPPVTAPQARRAPEPPAIAPQRTSTFIRWGVPAVCAIVAFVAGRFSWNLGDTPPKPSSPAAVSLHTGPITDPNVVSSPDAVASGRGVPGAASPRAGSDLLASAGSIAAGNGAASASSTRSNGRGDVSEGEDRSGRSSRRGGRRNGGGDDGTHLRSSNRALGGGAVSSSGSKDTVRVPVRIEIPIAQNTSSTTDLAANGKALPTDHAPTDTKDASSNRSDALASQEGQTDPATARLREEARLAAVADSLGAELRSRAAAEAMAGSDEVLFAPLAAAHGGGFLGAGFSGIDYWTRLGVEFAGGEHQLYALFGSTGYDVRTVDMVNGIYLDGKVSGTERAPEPQRGSIMHRDTWYGVGYRYSLPLMDRMTVGSAFEGGIGGRYLRIGLSFPAMYDVNGMLRLELAPTMQYLSSIGETVTSATRMEQVTPNRRDEHIVTETLETTGRLRLGLGLGLSFLFR